MKTTSKIQTPFMNIADACKATGLSMHFLRAGCKTGEVPHVMSGNKYMVNVAALLRKYGAEDGSEDDGSEKNR